MCTMLEDAPQLKFGTVIIKTTISLSAIMEMADIREIDWLNMG